ncbi:MAG: cation:proton antiporter regulatory subunit [Thermoanaerobacterales bacterium]|nr:cation:proton antiporter regulatory subunit [Bacillota bacterium]MDI6907237.1 cation:proton antiporter regulatory subunit [Thermoanaerobacterales bacterium]
MGYFREADLPGLGKKYSLRTHRKENLSIVIHHDGKRELYIMDRHDEPLASITLQDDEARQVGAILSGAFFKPKAVEDLEVAIEGLRIEWFKLTEGSPLAGRSIGELGIRHKTGVSIIAIIRGEDSIPNPGPDCVLQEGDTIVALAKHFKDFRQFLQGK